MQISSEKTKIHLKSFFHETMTRVLSMTWLIFARCVNIQSEYLITPVFTSKNLQCLKNKNLALL